MARSKATFKTVDLSRAIKAARAGGLTISTTRIEPDGSIILNHAMLDNESREIDADDVLAQWQACHTTYVVARAHSLCFPEYPDNVEDDLHAGMMGMKTMTASAASKEFGLYMDTVQHEPVIITKQNRPVAITLSIQQAERLLQGQVEAGIASGLEDVAAGRYVEMTPSHLEALRERFQSRIR